MGGSNKIESEESKRRVERALWKVAGSGECGSLSCWSCQCDSLCLCVCSTLTLSAAWYTHIDSLDPPFSACCQLASSWCASWSQERVKVSILLVWVSDKRCLSCWWWESNARTVRTRGIRKEWRGEVSMWPVRSGAGRLPCHHHHCPQPNSAEWSGRESYSPLHSPPARAHFRTIETWSTKLTLLLSLEIISR